MLHTKVNEETRTILKQIAQARSISMTELVGAQIAKYLAAPHERRAMTEGPFIVGIGLHVDKALHLKLKRFAVKNRVTMTIVIHTAINEIIQSSAPTYIQHPPIIDYALKDTSLTASARQVLFFLVGKRDAEWFQLNKSECGRSLGLAYQTVLAAIKELVARQYLQQNGSKLRINV